MGSFKFEGEKILIKYSDGTSQVYEINPSHSYKVGTIFFDYNGDRYFLSE